jgi:uncharacterized protein YraI
MKNLAFLVIMLVLFSAGCGNPAALTQLPPTVSPVPSPSPTLTSTRMPTETSLPPTATPTLAFVEGTLAIKVNVRSGPGLNFESIGLLDAGEKVQVIFKDGTGAWYQILYPAASGGRGWLAAQFVQVAQGTSIPLESTPTPAGLSGRILQRLNVRSGPGITFNSLGTLEPDGLVFLTGKNATASWFQISYPSGPGGHGWVTAQYIQTDVIDLPVLDDFGTPVAISTSGPASTPIPATPTVGPAYPDHDSAASPAVRVTFSASGTHQFTYSSQVSAPQGDPADWIEFTPYAINSDNARLVFSLACSGSATLTVEIQQGGSSLEGWGTLACGEVDKLISLPAGKTYQVQITPAPGQGLRLVDYVLTVRNNP